MPRPQPRFPEPDTEAFWNATKQHRLTYQVCRKCSNVVFYPRSFCTACGSPDLDVRDSKGEGTVYTYSVVRLNRHPAFAPLGPYAVAYVDLDEGFRILTNVMGVADPVTGVKIGMRVKVQWEDQEGENAVALPLFVPA